MSPLFHNSFNIYLQESNCIFIWETWLFNSFFLNSANLICRGTFISKYFKKSHGLRVNESQLYNDVGHPERDHTLSLIRECFYWPRMTADFEKWVTECQKCLVHTVTSLFIKFRSRQLESENKKAAGIQGNRYACRIFHHFHKGDNFCKLSPSENGAFS